MLLNHRPFYVIWVYARWSVMKYDLGFYDCNWRRFEHEILSLSLVSHFKPYDIIHFKSQPVSQSFTYDIFPQSCYFSYIQFRFDCLAWLKKRIETINTVKMLSMISNEVIILAQLDCNEIAIDRGLDCGSIRFLITIRSFHCIRLIVDWLKHTRQKYKIIAAQPL